MNTREFVVKSMIIFGQMCPKNLTKFQKYLYYVYGGTVFLLLHILSVIFQFTLIVKSNSLQEATNVLYICINSFLSSIKFSITYIYSKELNALEAKLFSHEFLPCDETERNIQAGYQKFYRYAVSVCTSLAIQLTIVLCADPLFKKRNTPYDLLPMKMWIPCQVNESNVWLVYTYQSLILLYSIENTNFANLNYFYWCNQLTMQFDILANRLKMIPELARSSINNSLDKNYLEKYLIVKYVKYHQKIYEFCEALNDVYRKLIILQFLLTAFTLSMTIFLFTTRHQNFVEISLMTTYFTICLVEIFNYCFFSNQITSKSEKFYVDVCKVDVDLLMRKRKFLSLIIFRSFKPVYMNGGPLINLTLSSFLKIVKTSFSAFNLMMSVNDQK